METVYKYQCPGCDAKHVTTVPKHNAPYHWVCACGWRMVVQTDHYGLAVGWTKPLRRKPDLRLVK